MAESIPNVFLHCFLLGINTGLRKVGWTFFLRSLCPKLVYFVPTFVSSLSSLQMYQVLLPSSCHACRIRILFREFGKKNLYVTMVSSSCNQTKTLGKSSPYCSFYGKKKSRSCSLSTLFLELENNFKTNVEEVEEVVQLKISSV